MEKGVETCSWEKLTIKVSGLLPCEETITIVGDVGERPSRKRPNSRSTTLDGWDVLIFPASRVNRTHGPYFPMGTRGTRERRSHTSLGLFLLFPGPFYALAPCLPRDSHPNSSFAPTPNSLVSNLSIPPPPSISPSFSSAVSGALPLLEVSVGPREES